MGSRREGVEVGLWLGMPGADAAEAARALGLMPAMEMVPGGGESGVVVGQDPPPGELVAHGSMVVVQVAEHKQACRVATGGEAVEMAAEADDGDADVDGEFGVGGYMGRREECWDAGEEEGHEEERGDGDAEDGESWESAEGEEGGLGDEPSFSVSGEDELRRLSEWESETEELCVREAGLEPPAQVVSRIRWLLVVAGWRVCWWEVAGVCLLVVVAALGLGGGRALAGLAAASVVLAVGVVSASLAGHGDGRGPSEPGAMVVDLDNERRRR